MQGFIEVMGMSDKKAIEAMEARDRDGSVDLLLYSRLNLIAVGSILAVAETDVAGMTRIVLPTGLHSYAVGTVADIAAKIAAAQRPQVPEQEAALFDGPSIKVEGWDGMVALRACDITGIVAVGGSKTKSVIHLRRGGSVEALTEPEAVEALIRAAREGSGKGAA